MICKKIAFYSNLIFRLKKATQMWKRVVDLNRPYLTSSIQIFKRLQSATQYYRINDDLYGFTDDQKQVLRLRLCLLFVIQFFYYDS